MIFLRIVKKCIKYKENTENIWRYKENTVLLQMKNQGNVNFTRLILVLRLKKVMFKTSAKNKQGHSESKKFCFVWYEVV